MNSALKKDDFTYIIKTIWFKYKPENKLNDKKLEEKGFIMRRVLSVVLSFLMAFTTLFNIDMGSGAVKASGSDTDYRNVAYYASWDGYARNYPLTKMDFSKITHLNFAFANLNADGSVVVGDEWIDTQITSGVYGDMGFNWEDAEAGMAGHFGALKKIKEQYPDLKTLISIGGWTWSKNFSDVAADASKRAVMAKTAVDFCVKYGFDGVDIDWEYPVEGGDNITHRENDGENYVLMVKAIREALDIQGTKDGKKYYLTIAAGCNPSFPANAHINELMDYLDWINLMAYDFHGAFDPKTNFNAPLYLSPEDTTGSAFNIDSSVKAFIEAGVDPKDMNLGLAFYGRGWINVNASGEDCLYHDGSSTTAAGTDLGTWEGCSFDFWDIQENYIGKRGYIRYWDDYAKIPYLYSEQTKTFISYDDEESIGIKLDYIKNMGLGGAMYWEASGDRNGTLLNLVGTKLNIDNKEGESIKTTQEEIITPEQTTQAAPTQSETEASEQTTQAEFTQAQTKPVSSGESGNTYPAWENNTVYKLGDIVAYQNAYYECTYAHTSNSGWTPSEAQTLWKIRTDLEFAGVTTTEGSGEGGENNYYVNSVLPDHVVTGYWHNFCNGSANLKLRDVPSYYDLICVAFTGSTSTPGEAVFELDKDLCTALGGYTEAEFIQDIKLLKEKNQHVIISVGGAEGTIHINSDAAADKFAESLISVIEKYGFEGVDIDLEGSAVAGVDYIASALRKVQKHFGRDFIITMAPETIYMQSTGASYFKLALEIKDILTIVNMQFYNSGSMIGYGGGVYSQGTADFLTSLATLLIENGLRPDQVGIGVPSCPKAGSGYVSPETLISAVNCMVYGSKTDGSFMPPEKYPELRGVMTWSINWDATQNYLWASQLAPAVAALPETDKTQETSTEAVIKTSEAASENPTQSAGGYDLIVTDIEWDSKTAVSGSQVVFTVTAKNIGTKDVPSGTVIGCQVQIDGNTSDILWCDTYSGGLKAGQSVKLTCNSGTDGRNYWTAAEGTHSVTAWVDDVNRLPDETNEDNNKLTVSIKVTAETETTKEAITEENSTQGQITEADTSRLLIGYYHTWDNSGNPFIKLRDVDENWDVINISFAEPVSAGSTDGKMQFNISGLSADYTKDDFKQDIKYLQSKGKKVVLSIGGYEGYFSLTSQAAADQFVSDIKSIVDEYGFDGIDIDLEQSSVQFESGNDTDINNPKSPKIVNMINAIRAIVNSYGDDFILSWAPETFYVQLGYQFYGGINQYCDSRAGVYLPMINALRDETTYVHVQLYNSSPMIASDNQSYNMGTEEGIIAMCKMLLDGFYVNNYYTELKTADKYFAPLRPDQVVIGVPSSASAAGSGQISNEALQRAFTKLNNEYPGLRGIMTWSINWDSSQNGNSFAEINGSFLEKFNKDIPVIPTTQETTEEAPETTKDAETTKAAEETKAPVDVCPTVHIEAEDFVSQSGVGISGTNYENSQVVNGIGRGDSMTYSVTLLGTGNYIVDVRASRQYTGASVLEVYVDGKLSATIDIESTGLWKSFETFSSKEMYLTKGTHEVTLKAVAGGYNINWFEFVGSASAEESTSSGDDADVKLHIEAEDYENDAAVGISAAKDQNSEVVNGVDKNDVMVYTVNVPVSGSYTFSIRASRADAAAGIISIRENGKILGKAEIGKTGAWSNFEDFTGDSFFLSAGTHTLTLYADSGRYNLNWFELEHKAGEKPSDDTTESSQEPLLKNVRIEAEDYVKMSGVSFSAKKDQDSAVVNSVDAGDWMDYTVNIPVSGIYRFDVRASRQYAGLSVLSLMENGSVIAKCGVVSTGAWSVYNEFAGEEVYLTAGTHTFRVYATGGKYNINWYELKFIKADEEQTTKVQETKEPEETEPSETEEQSTQEFSSESEVQYSEWNAEDIYVQGDCVVYEGHVYTAKWWNQNSVPGAEQWGPWELVK